VFLLYSIPSVVGHHGTKNKRPASRVGWTIVKLPPVIIKSEAWVKKDMSFVTFQLELEGKVENGVSRKKTYQTYANFRGKGVLVTSRILLHCGTCWIL
jgi:hypothetical protein